MILLLSDKTDVHYQRIKSILDGAGVRDTVTLDSSCFPVEHAISYAVSDKDAGKVVLDIGGQKVCGDEITSVWNRRTPPIKHSLTTPHLKEYVNRESQAFFDSLPYILINSFWLSRPDAVRAGSLKPNQLRLAKELGFIIPNTYIGNSPTEAEKFTSRFEELIVKSIFMPAVEIKGDDEFDALTFFTKKVTKDQIMRVMARVQNCPVILQPYIEKAFELRITVVGEEIFACAIYSQVSERTREDWRRYDLLKTPHEIFNLPDDIQNKILALVKRLGLVFGCIDMIVTPEGEFVFLEINSNGQWLWIEELTQLPIGEAIARLLIG